MVKVIRNLTVIIGSCAVILGASQASSNDTSLLVDAFETVCLRAQEKLEPPRDLAEAKGFVAEEALPERVGPHTPFSRAWRVPVENGQAYVVSTVIGPPASPYSCMISAYGVDAAELAQATETMLTSRKKAFSLNSSQTTERSGVRQLKYDRSAKKELYSVLLVNDTRENISAPNAMLVSYCVGCKIAP